MAQTRRQFMNTLTSVAVASALSGCGSGDSNSLFFGAQNGSSGNPGGSSGAVPFSGRINLPDFGGRTLNVQTIQQKLGPVGNDGSFTTMLGGSNPQLLFITEPLEQARPLVDGIPDFFAGSLLGLGLYLPGVAASAVEFGLNSTATAMIFLAFGILTMDPSEAIERIRRIQALPGYSSFVDHLRTQLATKSLAEIGNDLEFRRLKQKCVEEFFEAPVQAKLTAEEYAELLPQGLLRTQKGGVDESGKQSVSFENHGYRYVTVIRQELDASGNETALHLRPPLWGANVGGFTTDFKDVRGVLGGGNTAGWGSLFTGQTLDPNTGLDKFKPHPNSTQVKYWAVGPGAGSSIQLPTTILESEFGPLANGLTGFYYFLLPLFDLVTGGLAGLAVEKTAAKLFDEGSVESLQAILTICVNTSSFLLAGDGLRANYKTENPGNITAAWIDMLAVLCSIAATSGKAVFDALVAQAAAEAAAAAAAGGAAEAAFAASIATGTLVAGVALGVLAAIFTVAGLAFAMCNFGTAIKHHLTLPAVTSLPVALTPATGDYAVIYTKQLTTEELNTMGFRFSYVAVNSAGHLVLFRESNNGVEQRLFLAGRGDAGEISDEVAFPPNVIANSPDPRYRPLFINSQGDRVWVTSTAVTLTSNTSTAVFDKAGASSRVEIPVRAGDSGNKILSMPNRDGADNTLVYYHAGFPIDDLFAYGANAGVSGQIQVPNFSFGFNGAFAVNNNFAGVGIYYVGVTPTLIRYQHPTIDTPATVEVLKNLTHPFTYEIPVHNVAINDAGDYVYTEFPASGFAELVIKRGAAEEIRVPAGCSNGDVPDSIFFNDVGDVITHGRFLNGLFIPLYPADGTTHVGRGLTQYLPERHRGHKPSDVSVAGRYVAIAYEDAIYLLERQVVPPPN